MVTVALIVVTVALCESASKDGGGIDQLSSTFRLELEGDVDTDADS